MRWRPSSTPSRLSPPRDPPTEIVASGLIREPTFQTAKDGKQRWDSANPALQAPNCGDVDPSRHSQALLT